MFWVVISFVAVLFEFVLVICLILVVSSYDLVCLAVCVAYGCLL